MNKQRIHNILSSIQMSPRDKKDLINAIANSGGGINEQTPIKEQLDGTELVPIFDGENKAVNVSELVKDGKEVYYVDLMKWKGKEDHDKLLEAFNNDKIIYYKCMVIKLSINHDRIMALEAINSSFDNGLDFFYIQIDNNYKLKFKVNSIDFIFAGNGTKFLSDDGTYKTIDITSLQTQITALQEKIAALEGANT